MTLSGPHFAPKSGHAPQQLVVLLHGLGADGNDLISLAPLLAEFLPDALFLSPDAPEPCDMAPFGRQWFSLREWSAEAMLAGVRKAEPVLNAWIDEELKKHGLEESKLGVLGFSQGTMTALHALPRRAKPCAGLAGFSGALMGAHLLAKEAISKPPVCLVHGEEDLVVPFETMAAAEKALKEAGFTVETHARPGLPHGIDPEGIDIAGKFLKSRLAA
ncbi:MAG: dienelactone hydrolase family protein [Alphaproteobacteria bacterium]|nr:dienelactone hydrolase family protein [Alphaproteobacteria bacterium]